MENNSFQGRWHIYEMEMWDEDYFNMEVQAFIEIKENDFVVEDWKDEI